MRSIVLVALLGSSAAAGTVSGRVVEYGVRVAEYGVVTPDGRVHEVKDGDGRFTIDVPAGIRTLRLVGWAFATRELEDVKVLVTGPTDVGTIVVEPGRHAAGRVIDDNGEPVAGASVIVFDHSPTELRAPLALMAIGIRAAITGEDGSFVIDGIGEGNYVIAARSGDRTSLEHALANDLDLELAATGSITGTAPRPGETMIAIAADHDDATYTTEISADGQFSFEALPVGRYDLTLGGNPITIAPVASSEVWSEEPTPGGNMITIAPLRVEVRAGKTVVAPFAVPKQLANLVVRAHDDCVMAQLFGARQHEHDLVAELATQTCEDGKLRFFGLAPGRYRLCVDDDRCEELTVKASPRVQTVRLSE